mgnify:CR=1 FL=1
MLPLIYRTDIVIGVSQLAFVRYGLSLTDFHALFVILQSLIEIIQIDIDNPNIIQDICMQFRIVDIMDIHAVLGQAEIIQASVY